MTCTYCGDQLDCEELDYRHRAIFQMEEEGTSIVDLYERSGSCSRCGTRNCLTLGEEDELSLYERFLFEDSEEPEI